MSDAEEAKADVLFHTGPTLAARLADWDAAYFLVASETCADPDDREAVLWRLVELYEAKVARECRRAEAETARLVDLRRHGLRIVTEPQAKETA